MKPLKRRWKQKAALDSVHDYRVYTDCINILKEVWKDEPAFKSVQLVDDQQGRRMLKIGEVSKQSGIGIEALRFMKRAGCSISLRAPTGLSRVQL